MLAKLGGHAEAVEAAYRALPEIPQASEYDWEAQRAEERRARECFALTDEDARRRAGVRLPARTPGLNGRGDHRYVTDPEWLADRLVQKIAAHAPTAVEKHASAGATTRAASAAQATTPRRRRRREQRERQYESARIRPRAKPRPRRGARALGAEARHGRGQAPRLARAPALRQGGGVGARLCVDQPTTTNKQGR